MLENVDNPNWLANSYCGYRMTQMWRDVFMWEEVLNAHPPFDAIIELGTAHGGFSKFLQHQCQERGWKFHTFDYVDPINDDRMMVFGNDTYGGVADLGTDFQKVNVLIDTAPVTNTITQYDRVVLFCDNGHKAREVELYSPHLKQGSLLVVHDWNREIFPSDIPVKFTQLYGEECDKIDSWTRFFLTP